MDDRRFREICDEGGAKLTALIAGPALGLQLPGDVHYYNAYFNGTECVVLGYTYTGQDGDTITKPVAILVDPEVFARLRVDGESGRVDDQGNDLPPQVI